ncbi:hypothetical protein, partial [Rhodococcus sp. HNM0569]|uniref:hypothetical protein n=1 Tax=Rhodococcus sp. HNM0569 TaxID=2716340 RepID=UPI001F0FD90C
MNERRAWRSSPREISTPCGWNGDSAATFSRFAAVNASSAPVRTVSTSSGESTTASVRGPAFIAS